MTREWDYEAPKKWQQRGEEDIDGDTMLWIFQ
jgi:hypothetical protein